MTHNRFEKIDFGKFDEMVNDHNSRLTDVIAPMDKMSYLGRGAIITYEETGLGNFAKQGDLNQVGYRQLCSRLGAPHQWLQTSNCPDDLESTIIRRLQADKTSPMLWRFRDDECRAVLSDKYLVYNHADFWKDVRDSIVGTSLDGLSPVIWKPFVNNSLDAWILFENVSADPQTGEEPRIYDGGGAGGLRPAIHIHNTEDGTGRVRINSGLFRSYCTNGVIFGWNNKSEMAAEHLGKSIAHMQTKVALAIADAASLCKLGIDKFLESTTVKIKTDVFDKIVAEWAGVFSIAADTSKLWSAALGNAQTWGDVVMATSDFAGNQADRDVQIAIEEAAGAMLISGPSRNARA